MMNENFAVFILSHGRPKNIKTYTSLRKSGYTGKIYILVDNEDNKIDEYEKNFPNQIIVFDKKEAAKITDAGDNFGKRNSVVYARNQNFKVASDLGLTHFWQLDDDYTTFRWTFDNDRNYITRQSLIKNLDACLDAMMDFMNSTTIHCLAFSQGGDFIGGEGSGVSKQHMAGKLPRKVMNSFMYRTDRTLKFYGRMNDDVNMYVVNGNRGMLLFTLARLRLEQAETQASKGGLTEMYLESGTYVKSFYTVMYAPSCTKIRPMGNVHKRLHHQIKWKNAVPCLVSENLRKQTND